eukprot:CAMPEP_0197672470 /NCGR_PEP_ID=MMETSP1338-20131121/79021_1 /TAXON_ID=43686 ORGANISM="Pelagodinium beii, Strain RCC1491" /NCGR_SAMPLE_ID=MMETSP1338 /ASSEMBLY_ACC=CAM_ASM_000754 /LENGTH=413 /DNA_ID=CAMNT_0043252581 /DNA_START=54 /DNA_END=1292 /DNA_ORIENTATION=+
MTQLDEEEGSLTTTEPEDDWPPPVKLEELEEVKEEVDEDLPIVPVVDDGYGDVVEVFDVPSFQDGGSTGSGSCKAHRETDELATQGYGNTQATQLDFDLERALSQVIMEEFPQESLGRLSWIQTATPNPPAAAAGEQVTLRVAPGKRGMTDCWDRLWDQLRARGWSEVHGPRGDSYYLPPGVQRKPPWKNRVHYFDSKLQIVRHLRDSGNTVVEVVSEEADAKPVVGSRKAVGRPKAKTKAKAKAKAKASACTQAKMPAGRQAAETPVQVPPTGEVPGVSPLPLRPVKVEERTSDDWQGPESVENFSLLWDHLVTRGWLLEESGPRKDRYYLPPGVKRFTSAKLRVDYFDSQRQVQTYVQKHFLKGKPGGSAPVRRGPGRPKSLAQAEGSRPPATPLRRSGRRPQALPLEGLQ